MKTVTKIIIPIIVLSVITLLYLKHQKNEWRKAKPQQTQGKNNLKQMAINLTTYIADHHKKTMLFPPITDTPNGLLDGDISGTDPFFKTAYVYSGEIIDGYTIKEGEPIPTDPIIFDKIFNAKVNLIIVKDAKKVCTEGSIKYAPLKPYCLRGDFCIGDEN